MKRGPSHDSWQALTSVTNAAERFVNHTPRLKRLETERQALLDAIREAQLLLSVKRWPAGAKSDRRLSPASLVRHPVTSSSRRT
jgi:hypothetical protein